jgi:hypothetical protein
MRGRWSTGCAREWLTVDGWYQSCRYASGIQQYENSKVRSTGANRRLSERAPMER